MNAVPSSVERQFSLVLALVSTTAGLQKSEILRTVHGYAQRPSGDEKAAQALDRLFERDKTALRELGVPIETIDDPNAPQDTRMTRYRIPRAAYELPDDVSFTPGELSLLGLAASVWQESSLSADSRRALTKLRGLGIAASDPVVGYLPLVRAVEPALDPLRTAIQDRLVVEFEYLKPSDAAPTRRRVSPLELLHHLGRWLLVAADADGTRKTFLVRRIVGTVRLTADAALAPEPDEMARQLVELERVAERNAARIAVAPGSDAALRLRNRPGSRVVDSGVVEVRDPDLALLADELVALQPEATVLAPPALVDLVVERLARLEAAHG
ncbi:MAG: WYL domain-containing protein [Microbacteriaceae bacterium]|nr:WYL domain-containing protein [Microbacteriaceae bacterium]